MFLWVILHCGENNFDFFGRETSNGFSMEPMFIEDPTFFVVFLELWGSDFAPARGSPANVKDDVMTCQDYRNGEHPKTSLLCSSLAKTPKVLV